MSKVIKLKTKEEMSVQMECTKITTDILNKLSSCMQPGVTAQVINDFVQKEIYLHEVKPAFLNHKGFPGVACVSVNEELIHGIPSSTKVLKEGDIVTVDIGIFYKGMFSDLAKPYLVGSVSQEVLHLFTVTQEALKVGIAQAKIGSTVGDISFAIGNFVTQNNFYVDFRFVGHGIGKNLHEGPAIPNFGKQHTGPKLVEGMVLCIEPMVLLETNKVVMLKDGFTVVSKNGLPTCHWEGMVFLTTQGIKSFYA